jgi:hypothetical protein
MKVAVTARPYGLSGIALVVGYVAAALRRQPRLGGADYRAFTRRELRRRVFSHG